MDAVNRQSQEIEAKVDAKISEKITLRDEIHGTNPGTNQCMENQHKFYDIYDTFDF